MTERETLAGVNSNISSQWSETDVYAESSASVLAWKSANPPSERCWSCMLN